MINLVDYIRYNREKFLTLQVWFVGAFYRVVIRVVPANKMKKMYGTEGVETSRDESDKNLKRAWKIGFHVNRICEHTPWESKCLVRALTAQTLLHWSDIPSTMYLGVGKKDGKMVAHAWVRCGSFYVTGGDGSEYAVVAKFKK